MLYGSECWAVDKKMSVAEMRMLRWISGVVTREDRIINEYARGTIGIALMVDQMRDN